MDGLLGLGPTGLTYGTLTDQPNSEIPTDSDNLLSQGKISSEVVGISFNPATSLSSGNGELTFGGVDPSKYTGSITYTPITSVSPAKYYWGIDQSITYGSSGATILGKTGGIVDTDTTLSADPRISLGQRWMVRRVSLDLRLQSYKANSSLLDGPYSS